MKLLISLIAFSVFSNIAHAHPGGSTLVCKSAKTSGAAQKLCELTYNSGMSC